MSFAVIPSMWDNNIKDSMASHIDHTACNCMQVDEFDRLSFVAFRIQMLLYPHLLYPGQWICLTGTEFMVVAIAFER